LWDGGTLTGTYYKDANNVVVRHGTFRTTDKNGQLKQEETYSKGQIIGYFRKFANGKLVSEAFDGDNGTKQYEDYYNANGRPSLQRDFWEDGITKKSEYNFNDDGSLNSYYEYDHSGKNTIEEHYEKGKLVSSTKH
jgi:antitoxin component YwqK of YwqJK toxin-antitoxin module